MSFKNTANGAYEIVIPHSYIVTHPSKVCEVQFGALRLGTLSNKKDVTNNFIIPARVAFTIRSVYLDLLFLHA